MSILSESRLHDSAAALGHVEKLLWPNGPECPHCGATDRIYVTGEEVGRHVRENVAREAWLMIDEGRHYRQVGTEFAGQGRVHHTRGEYVGPEDATIHTNTVEG